MKKHRLPLVLSCVAFVLLSSVARAEVQTLSSRGWTVSADPGRACLSLEYAATGLIARDLRLNLDRGEGPKALTVWSVRLGQEYLFIHTTDPETDWQVGLGDDVIRLACSVPGGVVTASLPAGKDRFPVRLLDPAGKPVDWNGTDEMAGKFGATHTRHGSFLPRENPDVLYLGLGLVSARNLHSLFDRSTDTGIEFPQDARLELVAGDSASLALTMPIGAGAYIRVLPEYYTRSLGLPVYAPVDDSYFDTAPVVWNSWTHFYSEVKEEDIVRNADWIARNLAGYGPINVTTDDGPDRGPEGEHYWISNWNPETFPHGGKWLARYITSLGLRPGLWLVPNAWAGGVKEHPGWYLRSRRGELITDYDTPALDSSNPEVLAFLDSLFTTLRDWGFRYYKFDGELALPEYVPGLDRSRLCDRETPPLAVYRNRWQVIRRATGPETFIEACPAGSPLDGIGYPNSYFNGEDVCNSWRGQYAFFASINANLFLNHIVSYIMPGEGICIAPERSLEAARSEISPSFFHVVSTREKGPSTIGVSLAEARTIATFSALSGATYSLSDNLPDLPEERVDILKKTLPNVPIVPLDLFSRGSYMHWGLWNEFTRPEQYRHDFPRVLDLKVNTAAGRYDVVALTNWEEKAITRRVDFGATLGLDPSEKYLAFDFWNQRLEGVFSGDFEAALPPHDTRVFIIRPLEGHPQLVATSRHITAALSIRSQGWDSARSVLSGVSSTLPGQVYKLFLYVPEGMQLTGVDADAAAMTSRLEGRLQELSFMPKKARLAWEARFSGAPVR